MAKIVNDEIPFKRSEVLISFKTHRRWLNLSIRERITFKRLTLLALLYYGHRKLAFDIEELKKSLPDNKDITTKRCKICFPVEFEKYYTDIAKKYNLSKSSVFYYFINKYIEWQFSILVPVSASTPYNVSC